jgi:DNA polymerase
MGSPSAKAIISKNFRLTEQRGIWFTDTGHAPFVSATYNPAFVLRMKEKEFAQGRQILIHDIATAKQKLTENSRASQQTLF